MIGSLTGVVAVRRVDGCLIEVGGVGYDVMCSATTLGALPPTGSDARLFTHLHVREDALALFGFATEAERTMFTALIGVAGVGPKVALQLCSSFSPEAFRKALVTDDVDSICAVPGIGKKTAGRVILELKEKLELPDLAVVVGDGHERVIGQARSALENLGYSPAEVRGVLRDLDPEDARSVEDVIRSALRILAS